MPFIILHGVPVSTKAPVLQQLRKDLVNTVSKMMSTPERNIPPSWIRPFCPYDLFGEPVTVLDGAKTVYVRLDTALFDGIEDDELPLRVVTAIGELVFKALRGEWEVEVCVGELHPRWKKLIEPSA